MVPIQGFGFHNCDTFLMASSAGKQPSTVSADNMSGKAQFKAAFFYKVTDKQKFLQLGLQTDCNRFTQRTGCFPCN